MPLGSDNDSHCPNKVKFSIPRVVQTRSTCARLDERILTSQFHLKDNECMDTRPIQMNHFNNVLVTNCDVSKWHIACCPTKYVKQCCALQAITKKKKCTSRIAKGSKGTPTLIYHGLKIAYGTHEEVFVDFWFCCDDIERCVKGYKRQFVLDWRGIPNTWPVRVGTKLSCQEILALEDARFQLEVHGEYLNVSFFGGPSTTTMDTINHPKPANPNDYATTRYGKVIPCNSKAPTIDHRNKWESACQVQNVTEVPYLGFGRVFIIDSGIYPSKKQYHVIISNFPDCSCVDFINMFVVALGKRGQWVNCKHLLYILYRLQSSL